MTIKVECNNCSWEYPNWRVNWNILKTENLTGRGTTMKT